MAQAIFPPVSPLNALLRQQALLQRTEVRKMKEADRAIADILSRTDLSFQERADEYAKLINKFQMFRDDILTNG